MPLDIIDEIRPYKSERVALRKMIAALGAVCLAVLLLIAAVWPTKAHALQIYQATEGTTSVTLTDEPCTLKAVENLPFKALWVEKAVFQSVQGA